MPSAQTLLAILLLAAAACALPIPSSLDLLSHSASSANANANQAPLGSSRSLLSFPVRPNPKGLTDYTRDMLDPILCPMAATGGSDSGSSSGSNGSRRPAVSGAVKKDAKVKGRGAGGDAGGLCAAWCERVKGGAADGAVVEAGKCDDSGSCVCADGTTLWSPAHYCTTSRTFLQTTYLSPSSRRLPCARFGFGKKLAPPHSLIGEPGDDSMGTKRRMWTNMHPDHACARLVLLRHATHYAGVVGFSLALLFWSWRCREMQSGRGTEGWETWRRLMFCMRCGKVSMNQDISSCCLLLRC
ncbi:hypothetical protein HDK77DRAFT_143080 [Phyllosticta capitalensis]